MQKNVELENKKCKNLNKIAGLLETDLIKLGIKILFKKNVYL